MGGPAWLGLRHWQTGFQHLGCSCCKLSFGPFLFLGLALLRGLRRGGFCTVDVVAVCFPGAQQEKALEECAPCAWLTARPLCALQGDALPSARLRAHISGSASV